MMRWSNGPLGECTEERPQKEQRHYGWLVPAGAKKGDAKQKLSWLDMLRQKSEQAQQRRKPEPTPSQSAGSIPLHPTCTTCNMCVCMYV